MVEARDARPLEGERMTRVGPEWAYKVVKESGIGLVGAIAGTALNYVLLMTVTRALAPAEYGTFALAQSVTTVALIAALFGTPRALDRYIPLFVASGDLGRARTLISIVFRMCLVAGAAAAVVLLLGSDLIARLVSNQPGLAPVLRLMALSLPMLVFIELVAYSFIGFKELRYQVYTQQLALPAIRIALVAVVFMLGYRLFGWVAVYLISLAFVSGLALMFFVKHIRPLLRGRTASSVSFSGIVSYSWPLTVNNIVLVFFGQIGVLLLGRFRPLEEVGAFRVYVYLVLIMVMVRASFTRIYKPVAAGMTSTGAGQ
jgi:stage V sporulation protein B